ncbi:MAG TPA: AraC family transcriptional regulator [Armatimonadota bacterium]
MRLSSPEIDISIWVSDLAMRETPRHATLHEVAQAESAHVDCVLGHMQEPHRHEEHEILTILDGAGRVQVEGGPTLPVVSGQIVVIPGGLTHILLTDDHITLRGLYLHPRQCRLLANDPSMPTAFGHAPFLPKVVADAHLFRSLQELFEQCQAEYAREDPWRTLYLQTVGRLTAIILARLMQLDERSLHSDPASLRVLNVRAWMDRHFLEAVTLPDLSQMAHLSPSQFSALFRRLCGASPKAYLLQRRLDRAAALLAETEISVTEVAAGVGFEHLAHFCRIFRDTHSLSPREYRKKHQQNPKILLA